MSSGSRLRPQVYQKYVRQLSNKPSKNAEALEDGPRPYVVLRPHIDRRYSTEESKRNNFYPCFSYHWGTQLPPTSLQLKHASDFFHKNTRKFLWSAPKFATMEFGSCPEVTFLGRSNVGKSTVLNALLGEKAMAVTSSKPGCTKTMNAFSVGDEESTARHGRKLVVLDMPGYGRGGHAEWGVEIMKYLEKREHLKMAFVLMDPEHGLKKTDLAILSALRDMQVPHQLVVSKVDKRIPVDFKLPIGYQFEKRLEEFQKLIDDLCRTLHPNHERDGIGSGEIICTSALKQQYGKYVGIDALRFAVLRAAGMEWNEPVKSNKEAEVEIVPYDQLVWKE